MSRVQLAINVADIDASVDFYEALFNTAPHKRRPGYANFEIANPPLKLVLMEGPAETRGTGVQGALNHLGVEVETTAEVTEQVARLTQSGMNPHEQEQTNCCHAVQNKAWVADPAGVPWEVYTITDDNPTAADAASDANSQQEACCVPSLDESAQGESTQEAESGGCCTPAPKSSLLTVGSPTS